MKKRDTILSIILLLLSLSVILIPRYILPVCEYYGKPAMKCSHMAHYEMGIGGALLVGAILLVIIKNRRVKIIMALLTALAGLAVVLLPGQIGYCRSPAMPCNYGTVPALRLAGSFTFIYGLTAMIIFFKGKKTTAWTSIS